MSVTFGPPVVDGNTYREDGVGDSGTIDSSYKVIRWTYRTGDGSTTWVIDDEILVDYLVVAGGGGGGGGYNSFWGGGGGGAGGYLAGTITLSGTKTIKVGAGGYPGVGYPSTTSGYVGGNSSISTDVVSIGGGWGGGSGGAGGPGGSGGGAGGHNSTLSYGGNCIPGQGYNGSDNRYPSIISGHGGGSSGPGTTSTNGPGTVNNISGSAITYATGGDTSLTAGTNGLGNGGGGAGQTGNPGTYGGSGVIIVRFKLENINVISNIIGTLTGAKSVNGLLESTTTSDAILSKTLTPIPAWLPRVANNPFKDYKKQATITLDRPTSVVNTFVQITIPYAFGMAADFADLRFAYNLESLDAVILDYVEKDYITLLIRVPYIGVSEITMYYNNYMALSAFSPFSTLASYCDLFEDFTTLDNITDKWTFTDCRYSISDNTNLHIRTTNRNEYPTMTLNTPLSAPINERLIYKVKNGANGSRCYYGGNNYSFTHYNFTTSQQLLVSGHIFTDSHAPSSDWIIVEFDVYNKTCNAYIDGIKQGTSHTYSSYFTLPSTLSLLFQYVDCVPPTYVDIDYIIRLPCIDGTLQASQFNTLNLRLPIIRHITQLAPAIRITSLTPTSGITFASNTDSQTFNYTLVIDSNIDLIPYPTSLCLDISNGRHHESIPIPCPRAYTLSLSFTLTGTINAGLLYATVTAINEMGTSYAISNTFTIDLTPYVIANYVALNKISYKTGITDLGHIEYNNTFTDTGITSNGDNNITANGPIIIRTVNKSTTGPAIATLLKLIKQFIHHRIRGVKR